MFGVWPVRPGADSVQNAVAECIRPAARLKASDFLPLPAHRPVQCIYFRSESITVSGAGRQSPGGGSDYSSGLRCTEQARCDEDGERAVRSHARRHGPGR